MYIFLVELPETVSYTTPVKTDEWILDWKDLSWLLHPKNTGVTDVKYYLSTVVAEETKYEYKFTYDDNGIAMDFIRYCLNNPC